MGSPLSSEWGRCPLWSACRQTLCASKRDLGIAVPPRVAGTHSIIIIIIIAIIISTQSASINQLVPTFSSNSITVKAICCQSKGCIDETAINVVRPLSTCSSNAVDENLFVPHPFKAHCESALVGCRYSQCLLITEALWVN